MKIILMGFTIVGLMVQYGIVKRKYVIEKTRYDICKERLKRYEK